jgi:hypothetical protein
LSEAIDRRRPSDEAPTEPVSPELALVDPDLARAARERMPFHPPRSWATAPDSTVRPGDAAGSADEEVAAAAPPTRRRRRRLVLTIVLVMALAGAGIAAAALIRQEEDPDSASTVAGAGSAVGSRRESTEPQARQPASPAPPAATARPAAPKRPATKRRPAPKPAAGGPDANRLFIWLPVRGASHYRVEFFRNGTKIFEARPARARLELPERWTYKGRRFRVVAGRYRWSVRPGFGSGSTARYAPAIVRSVWVVSS